MRTSFFSAILIATLLGLTGCSSDKIKPCPAFGILADAASRTTFKPGGFGDPSAALYKVELTNLSSDCSYDDGEGKAESSLTLTFHATRAPNGEAASYTVSYFIAVTQGKRILDKKIFVARFDFAPGQSSSTFTEDVEETDVKVEEGKTVWDYGVLAGLQLTQGQLDYNKTMGRYSP